MTKLFEFDGDYCCHYADKDKVPLMPLTDKPW